MDQDFYERDTATVARELLGKTLTHKTPEGVTSGRIVETEAYYGKGDPASRASKKKTKLNELMWERGGLAFVYVVHGHELFNVTTEREDVPGAVLIRALDPIKGIKQMQKRRPVPKLQLTSGPGKLTQAMGIKRKHHKLNLTDPKSKLTIVASKHSPEFEIGKSHRIGVTEDLKRDLRFFIRKNPYVSR